MKTENDTKEIMVDADDSVISRALTGSLIVFGVIGLLIGGSFVGYYLLQKDAVVEAPPSVEGAKARNVGETVLPSVSFTDITSSAGIEFVHENGARGKKYLPETMGSGVAVFDYDNDNDLDILFVNSTAWAEDTATPEATTTLYQNQGDATFKSVNEEVGLNLNTYGMGVAVADFDNDGWRDIFISAVGKNRLLRNNQGKFEDVTDAAGVGGNDQGWSTSCGFFDYDNDGNLDLFVCNYIEWSHEIDMALGSTLDGVNRAYGPPTEFKGTYPYLYHNKGDGTFEDVSEAMGLHITNRATNVPVAKSLGLAFADCNQDGWLDVMVANDTVANLLFVNQEGKSFEEQAQFMGVSVAANGQATGAMGIDSAYLRNNSALGVAIGNFANEPASLYVSPEPGMPFADEEKATGLGPQTRMELTFGLFFFDFDLDGRLDLFTANGHLEDEISKVQASVTYEQAPHLFWNAGAQANTEFVTMGSELVGDDFVKPMVGRAAAYGDLDGDGDLDLVITSSGRAPRILRNDQELGHHWLRVHVTGPQGNMDGIGAEIKVETADQSYVRTIQVTRSYLAQCEPIATFGFGAEDPGEVKVTVTWPGGKTKVVENVKVDQLLEIQP